MQLLWWLTPNNFVTVVDRNSAIIGDAFEKKSTIYATHQDMCRFLRPDSDGYRKILASLREIITIVGPGDKEMKDSLYKKNNLVETGPIHSGFSQPSPEKQASSTSHALGISDVTSHPLTKIESDQNFPQTRWSTEWAPYGSGSEKKHPRKIHAILRDKGGDHMLSVLFEDRCLNIRFHRTVRLPDDGKTYNLPANLGTFPLFNISKFIDTMSQEVIEKGGFFLPMYRKYNMEGSQISAWIQKHADRSKPQKRKLCGYLSRKTMYGNTHHEQFLLQ